MSRFLRWAVLLVVGRKLRGHLVRAGVAVALAGVLVLLGSGFAAGDAFASTEYVDVTSPRDGQVRVEISNGHRFIAEVVEAFPGAVDSVGLHKPSLEDVFVRETGASIE